jgi:peptidoglycan/xylan/chitin deacetylase (PgdA/CDA1 family)
MDRALPLPGWAHIDVIGKSGFLSWKQIKEMANYGIDFQSHSCSHPHLTELGQNALEKEMRESKRMIEDTIGKPVDFLSYPYGEWNEHVKETAYTSGYKGACALVPGGNDVKSDVFTLSRHNISQSTFSHFKIALTPFLKEHQTMRAFWNKL